MSAEELTARSIPRPGDLLGDRDGAIVLVLAAPASAEILSCAGRPMMAYRPVPCGLASRAAHGTQPEPSRLASAAGGADPVLRAGQRFVDTVSGLLVQCLRGGPGVLEFDRHPMVALEARTGRVAPI